MRVNVFLPHSFKREEKADFIVGVDYGAYQLARAGIEMDLAIGDFDSTNDNQYKLVSKFAKKIIKLEVEKNETDSEAAIMYLQDQGFSDISLIGDIGSRLDHFLINFRLVEKYNITYILESGKIFLLNKGLHQIKNEYKVFSLFTSKKCRLSLWGTKYLINNEVINYFDLYTTANKITADYASVEVFDGSVVVVLSNDK